MSLTLENSIEVISKIFEFSDADHYTFMVDAYVIANTVYGKMFERNSIFKDMFKDFHKTAHYRKGAFFDIPDEFCSHLMLELPFNDIKFCFNQPHFVKLKTRHYYPLVNRGYVDAFLFSFQFHATLRVVLSELLPIVCDGKRIYSLNLHPGSFNGMRGWTRIIAKEIFCLDGYPGEITFEFLPVLKFPLTAEFTIVPPFGSNTYWTCTSPFPEPLAYRNRFRQFLPCIQLMDYLDMLKARKVIILVHSLVIYGKLSQISPVMENFIYKNVYFAVLQEKNIRYMRETSLDTIFLDLLWKIKCNIIGHHFPGDSIVYGKLEEICHTLIALKRVNLIPFETILKLFGLK